MYKPIKIDNELDRYWEEFKVQTKIYNKTKRIPCCVVKIMFYL